MPTASCFDQIITPGGKPSASAPGYMRLLLSELIMGRPTVGPDLPWLRHGTENEPKAVRLYEFEKDLDTKVVGFVTNDAGTAGASPDRFVGEDGQLEVKCPSPEVHVEYLLDESLPKKYKSQVQGQLWICERDWSDTISFHPEMPPAIVRVGRDEPFIKLMSLYVSDFVHLLAEKRFDLARRGLIHEIPIEPEFLTAADVEMIIAAHAKPKTEESGLIWMND